MDNPIAGVVLQDGTTVYFGSELDSALPVEVQLRGLLAALRYILGVPEGGSILHRASTIMRRYHNHFKETSDGKLE